MSAGTVITDLTKLKAFALAATPGPWGNYFAKRTVYDCTEDGCRGIPIARQADCAPMPDELKNIDFIAAANPAVVLELIALIETAHSAAGSPAEADQLPMGAGDPMAFFADFCDRKGYSSDGEMDEALRGVFYEGIRYCAVHTPAAVTAPMPISEVVSVRGAEAQVFFNGAWKPASELAFYCTSEKNRRVVDIDATVPASEAASVMDKFDRADLESAAEELEGMPQTVNVGNVTGIGEEHLEAGPALAARLIRAYLAAPVAPTGVKP